MARTKAMTDKLPKISLKVSNILAQYDASRSYVTFPSELEEVGYVGCVDDGIIVLTCNNGYLRIDCRDIDTVIEELTEYSAQLKERSVQRARME